jgi:hypothetical protein
LSRCVPSSCRSQRRQSLTDGPFSAKILELSDAEI